MAASAGTADMQQAKAWNPGVRARLLLAFFGISAFAVLAAAAAIVAFRQVGDQLHMVDARVPPTLSSLELSRSAERIIAAAPALLTATDRKRRDEITAELEAEVGRLNGRLLDLKRNRTEVLPLLRIEPIVSSLTDNLAALEDLVARRLNTNDRIKTLRRGVFQTNDDTQRLLAPWLMILDSQISRLVNDVRGEGPGDTGDRGDTPQRLASLVELQRPAQAAQRLVSTAVDMLAEASTTDQTRRLPVLNFQLGRTLGDLETTAAGLDPKLRPLFLEQVAKLRQFVEGPDAITAARKQELELIGEGERRLAENADLSAQLTKAVDQLAGAAKQDIGNATQDALSVQRLSTQILVAVGALSLLTSILIVWLYVGHNIVRRLPTLSDGMLAIAGGKLDAGIATQGADEIAAMGRAVEVFRRNAIELERLLAERKEAAARLEQVVEERTREVERRGAALRVTFDNMGHGVVMFGPDRRMVAWNRRFQELLELPNDRIGSDCIFEELIRYLAERGEFGPCDVGEEIGKRLTSLDRPYTDERIRPNGTVLEIRRNPVPSGGFVSIYADVTEQRKAQARVALARARLTDAIESISDGFALWDSDDRLAIFNSRCRTLLDAEDLFVVGTSFEDMIRAFQAGGRYGPSQGSASAWIAERLALHRNPPSTCDLQLANGCWLRITEFRTREGGTVTIWADITAAKERERELEAARDKADAASRTMEEAYRELKAAQANLVHAEKMASLGQLTAGIAHEIKNPLNFINNFANLSEELLRELKDALTPAMHALAPQDLAEAEDVMTMLTGNLSKIVEHGRRADGIVKSMLLHSRGGSGERQVTNLNALVDEALNLAYHGARAQDSNFNVKLERDFDPDLGPLELVPQDITRVFLNLFGNAFYATSARRRDGGGEDYHPMLRVTTRDLDNGVEVRVRDNGVGMPPEVRAKLFTPFFTTKPTGEGTGLGLSISYDIVVQQQGGTIVVDSRPGEFTEFVIRLPRSAARIAKPQIAMGAR
ncbi:PAS-domain containing protein [Microvirga massiliensis]|uniref:PAS-domain containing protein n=1 Tax=Microvirga massiliensis TaxID=1033741 RepID=UPI000699F6B2|nr:PAS-domain containing protein [Microvirga massiliensis]